MFLETTLLHQSYFRPKLFCKEYKIRTNPTDESDNDLSQILGRGTVPSFSLPVIVINIVIIAMCQSVVLLRPENI